MGIQLLWIPNSISICPSHLNKIRSAVENVCLDVENRVVLDIVPAPETDEEETSPAPASAQQPGEPQQPAAPLPQVPVNATGTT